MTTRDRMPERVPRTRKGLSGYATAPLVQLTLRTVGRSMKVAWVQVLSCEGKGESGRFLVWLRGRLLVGTSAVCH
jgi:hypothetical protein